MILSQLKVCNTSTCSTKARKSGKASVPSRELVTVSQDTRVNTLFVNFDLVNIMMHVCTMS